MDVVQHNRAAWNRLSRQGDRWCRPVGPDVIAAARRGDWSVILTPTRPVPRPWLGDVRGRDVLCLASGGGQQAPVLAAAGARVTSFDNADAQLAGDRKVADRDGLDLRTVRGDMADLSAFADAAFDLVFHPISNVFVPDPAPVWRECCRVLRRGGRLLAGFMNPWFYLFDHDEAEATGALVVRYRLPYSDRDSLTGEKRAAFLRDGYPYEFGHSLQAQLGGQTAAGLLIADFYEDTMEEETTPLVQYASPYLATLALKGTATEARSGASIPGV
jgi:SAM-dependent methyltransferase